jgi:hypothetical protein
MKMSWIHSSKGVVLGVLFAVSLATVGTAAAVSISGSPPGASAVGEEVSMNVTIAEPFQDAPEQWTLRGDTGLDNASWTVTTLQQGRTVATNEYGGGSFQQDLSIDSGTTEVEITVVGEVPNLTEFDYDDRAVENYTAVEISRVVEGNANSLQSWEVHRYTDQSRQARQAIAEGEAALANSSSSDAQNALENAKINYGNEEWESAIENAEDAQDKASGGLPLIPILGVVVLIAVAVGAVFYLRSQEDSGHKLQ